MYINDVVQFNENHKWCGCLGIIEQIKDCGDDIRYLVGVPVLEGGIAYIFCMGSERSLEYIGRAVMVSKKGDEDEDD